VKRFMTNKSKAHLIAFYLPQFYPIPENNVWWGNGFTEWTNVAKAKPLFRGHYQPHIPSDLGFYDLRVPEVRIAQAKLASEHGIKAFAYWHYWFGNEKRLLERPFNGVLKSGKPDFPFCLAWANQTWTGIWHAADSKILIEQQYPGAKDFENHFYHLLEAFLDNRYLKIDNKPLFLIYNPRSLRNIKDFTGLWNNLAIKEGLSGIFFMGICNKNTFGFQGFVQHAPILQKSIKESFTIRLIKNIQQKYFKHPMVYAYKDYIKKAIEQDLMDDEYPLLLPNWDNTPRLAERGLVLQGSTPELFEDYLKETLHKVERRPYEKRLIFIKSWNEWAEGNYLEPDHRFGKRYLEIIKKNIFDNEK
jgi:hypothetical protein